MSRPCFRLARGGRIDRDRPVKFSFDGRRFEGFAGDTLASALLASGRHMVARSFKYHRPRGIVGAGSEDPAALVQIGRGATADPNIRATEQEIFEGLEAFSQNCFPSLDFDVGAVNDLLSPFLSAGFYYKTFVGPPGSWRLFEPFLRRSAGIGRCPPAPDPDRYDQINRHCDVLVAGAGPAGIMAALSASRAGARVILCEETAEIGGRLLSLPEGRPELDGKPAADWLAEARAELAENPDVTLLVRTCVTGYYAMNFLLGWQRITDHLAAADRDPRQPRQRIWRMRARQVVLATGAIERPLVFAGNDRPGIMLAGAVRSYLHRYAVLPGQRAAVFTNNDSAWATAFDLAEAGATMAAIIDTRAVVDAGLLARAEALGIPVHLGSIITGTSGRRRLSAVDIAQRAGRGIGDDRGRLSLDLLAVSGGWSPNVALFSQSRGQLRYDPDLAAFRPGRSVQKERSAGAANGRYRLADCLAEGATAGAEAAAAAGFAAPPADPPGLTRMEPEPVAIEALWKVPTQSRMPDAFVDLQDDVKVADLELAAREGYRSVEHAKRYTTAGMGTDQGKIANMNAFGILAEAQGLSLPQIGTTTYRQPYKPVTIGALAGSQVGDLFHPRRGTPMHQWHRDNGAVFEPVGDWLRARLYPRTGEDFDAALRRECLAARRAVAVLDASTLGKIDIRGNDARTFLDRVYTNGWARLAPGRCRYGMMLAEDGMVMDDGVTACLADDHFHMTTTTGGAARVLTWLEDLLQTEWPELEVYLTSVTEQWAVAALCGPDSAAVVAALCDDLDPDPDEFEAMTWRDGHIDGVPVRIFRISFTGELSYEINIAASYGAWLWERVMDAGAGHGITPYGTEAMHVLRAEKGFVIIGQDTDGTVTPFDLGMDWIVKKKGDFIGRRSLFRSDTQRPDRHQLIGLLTDDPAIRLKEGAAIIAEARRAAPPVPMLGHVTSSYFSPTLDRSIALALVRSGRKRIGERLYVSQGAGRPVPVTVSTTDFLAAVDRTNA